MAYMNDFGGEDFDSMRKRREHEQQFTWERLCRRWEQSTYQKVFIFRRRELSTGESANWCYVWERIGRRDEFREILEYISDEEYMFRKLAGTLHKVPDRIAKNPPKTGGGWVIM